MSSTFPRQILTARKANDKTYLRNITSYKPRLTKENVWKFSQQTDLDHTVLIQTVSDSSYYLAVDSADRLTVTVS